VVGEVEFVGAFGAEGRWLDSTSSRHVGTLGKSFTRKLEIVQISKNGQIFM